MAIRYQDFLSPAVALGVWMMSGSVLAADTAGTCPPGGEPSAEWVGTGRVAGGKGYVDTPVGQVHYRMAGPEEGVPVLLLHQTPWWIIQYAEIQSCLAELSVPSLAVDRPGYGLSDPPTTEMAVEDYADNLVAVLDGLGIEKVAVAGHHTGAAVAATFAARHPDRVTAVILHGVPVYTEQERKERLALPHREFEIFEDGHHLSDYYEDIWAYAGASAYSRVSVNWSVLNWYLSGKGDTAHLAVFENDLVPALDAIEAPVLILSDLRDSLHANDQRTAERWSFTYRQFSEGTAHEMMAHPGRWAGFVAEFLGAKD